MWCFINLISYLFLNSNFWLGRYTDNTRQPEPQLKSSLCSSAIPSYNSREVILGHTSRATPPFSHRPPSLQQTTSSSSPRPSHGSPIQPSIAATPFATLVGTTTPPSLTFCTIMRAHCEPKTNQICTFNSGHVTRTSCHDVIVNERTCSSNRSTISSSMPAKQL